MEKTCNSKLVRMRSLLIIITMQYLIPVLIMSQKKIAAYVFDSETKKPIELVNVISSFGGTLK